MAFVLILIVIFFIAALFFGKELLKKFNFMRSFIENSNQMISWKYSGDKKPGMHNIVLRGKKPFCALIGFKLIIPILKYSGFPKFNLEAQL